MQQCGQESTQPTVRQTYPIWRLCRVLLRRSCKDEGVEHLQYIVILKQFANDLSPVCCCKVSQARILCDREEEGQQHNNITKV